MEDGGYLIKTLLWFLVFFLALGCISWLLNKFLPKKLHRWFMGIRAHSPLPIKIFLWMLPFILLILSYQHLAKQKLLEDPNNRSMPVLAKILKGAKNVSTQPDKRTGKIPLWMDAYVSLRRLLIGISISGVLAYFIGTSMGLFPFLKNLLYYLIVAISKIPPITILPILFIYFGVGELTKIILIALGTIPILIIDSYNRVSAIPHPHFLSYETKGLSDFRIFLRILKKNVPFYIDSVRNQLGPSWILLIAAESIAASSGLGYRIFFVRRMLAMDIIIPYLIFIVMLGLVIDIGMNFFNRQVFNRWVRYVK